MMKLKPSSFLRVTIFLLIFLVFGKENLFSQHHKLNSKKEFLDTIIDYRYSNPDSALIFVKQGIALAQKNKDDDFLAAMLVQYGIIDDNLMEFTESRQKYIEAEQLYKKRKDTLGIASTLIRLGEVDRRRGNLDKVMAYVKDALQLNMAIKNKNGLQESYLTLGKIFLALKNNSEALKNLHKAEELSKQLPLNSFTFNTYIYLGRTYSSIDDYKKAMVYLDKGISEVDTLPGFKGLKVNLLRAIGTTHIRAGKWQKGHNSLTEALGLARSIKNTLRELSVFTDLGHAYQKRNIDSAIYYFESAIDLAGRYNASLQQISLLNTTSKLYASKGDLAKALALSQRSAELSRVFYRKNLLKQIGNLETAYELQRTNAELKVLSERNSRQAMVKNIWLAVAISSFLILVIILAYFFRARHLNELLSKKNKELLEGNAVKDKIFSIVAHDVRSPLVSIIGVLGLINEKSLSNEEREELVSKLLLDSRNSLEVLDKLLRWGEMQLKGIRLNTQCFNPMASVLNNVELLNIAAQKKHIDVQIDVPENLKIEADPNQFDFVIRNLLANAIKFTEKNGKVWIKASPADSTNICFEVLDNGVGICSSRLDKIFLLSSTSTRGTSSEVGTSLGLVICKEFVEANGGRIVVESQQGVGSSFKVFFKGMISKIE